MAELRISTETVCFIVAKARTLDAKVAPSGLLSGSNPADDEERAILEDRPGDATEEELRRTLEALNGAEMADLIGLAWLGRGEETVEEWPDIMERVAEQHPEHPVAWLMQLPLLGDYLEEGLAALGLSCTESGEMPVIR
jgi:Protein of unknown function (DUF3775)